ncbi:hypothetical protein KCP71_10310 [Salmonella enterica subsp. enterica]|nr:hypothetical protein KCP71_10310 [Salmonella enterica subsp. enterica]
MLAGNLRTKRNKRRFAYLDGSEPGDILLLCDSQQTQQLNNLEYRRRQSKKSFRIKTRVRTDWPRLWPHKPPGAGALISRWSLSILAFRN